MSDSILPAQSTHPPIRSFVRRTGRLTGAQGRALQELWPRYGVEFAIHPIDLESVFTRQAPRVLEIGFGNGDTLLTLAAANPQQDFLGIEVHEPGVGRVLLAAQRQGLTNIRVSRHDAVEVLTYQLPAASFDEILIFFPDPWPKTRHHKRRLIQPPFIQLLTSRMRVGGILRLATDWQHYAEQMLEVLDGCTSLVNDAGKAKFVPRPDSRPVTRFERRGQRLGHGVWDLAYRKISVRETPA